MKSVSQMTTAKCTRLKRIGEHVYKVEGAGSGQTLTRQTSAAMQKTAAAAEARR